MTDSVRLAVNISGDAADILREGKRRFGWSATEAIRQAIGLLSFAIDTWVRGEKLCVASVDGKELRELVLNWETKK